MNAVVRELVSRNIVPNVAAFCGVRHQVSDEVDQLLLRAGDMLTSMQKRRELAAVVFVANQRIRLATTLAVYKPRGMTPYGQRKQREQHAALLE